MFPDRFGGKGNSPMATPTPVLPEPPKPDMLSVANAKRDRLTSGNMLLRSLPLVGMGGVLAVSISAPPGILTGIGILAVEIALGVLAVAVWAPRNTK